MFKVGDKVRVTDFKGADAYYINNKVGTIIQIPSAGGMWDCLVDIPPQGGIFTSTPFDFCELSLVKEFKIGDRVKVVDYTNVITGKKDFTFLGKIGNVLDIDSGMITVDIPNPVLKVPYTEYFTEELELVKEKFKVGDRVRFVNIPSHWGNDIIEYYSDKIGTITRINSEVAYKYRTDVPTSTGTFPFSCWHEDELELVKEFGVGARVKVKSAAFNSFIIGKTGTIIAIGEEMNKHTVTLDNVTDCPEGTRYQTYYFYENELELID